MAGSGARTQSTIRGSDLRGSPTLGTVDAWRTEDELVAARTRFESDIAGYERPAAYGVGVTTVAPSGLTLDAWFPHVNTSDHRLPAAVLANVIGREPRTRSQAISSQQLKSAVDMLTPAEACTTVEHPNLRTWRQLLKLAATPPPPGGNRHLVASFVADLQDPLVDAVDAYLRLHLLSSRLVRPHGTKLEDIFTTLNTAVWTDAGPFEPIDFDTRRLELAADGHPVRVLGVDKFPRMVDYVLPSGVRIADADRVRLGAHLAEGTVVMHEGFCNYNAGTLGPAMIEGRISAGVVIGEDSDVGGGASTMGTLSGGGKAIIAVGRNCLIGANAGIGNSLGDNCIVEAGLYVTAGSIVRLADGTTTKARDLSGEPGLLFRRNSMTGTIEAIPNGAASMPGLNPTLHSASP